LHNNLEMNQILQKLLLLQLKPVKQHQNQNQILQKQEKISEKSLISLTLKL
jgi:hypothetical protein